MHSDDTRSISVHAVPAFRDNYLWLLQCGSQAAIVDPGDAGPVEAELARRGLDLVAIVLTHHHADHIGGVAALLSARRNAEPEVFGPAHESISGITRPLRGGDEIRIADWPLTFAVLDVPGHTRGHIAYFAATPSPMLFCGDTLFVAGCGRLFEGTPGQMYESLSKLSALPTETAVYCAHEYTLSNLRFALAVDPTNGKIVERQAWAEARRRENLPTVPSTIGWERMTNPFLRCSEPALIASAEGQEAGAGSSPVATFAALRAYKDHFA